MKYFHSTVQRAKDRRQKFHFCRLPFDVRPCNVKLNLSNTYPKSKFHGKRIQRYLWDREHMERKTKVYMACSRAHMFVTCHVLSHVSVTVPVYWPWHALQKLGGGGHFGVLTGMWVFQNITLYRATNSAKSQAKIRFAFHFVERNK